MLPSVPIAPGLDQFLSFIDNLIPGSKQFFSDYPLLLYIMLIAIIAVIILVI